ncbi:cell division protein FtsQ/DivIB [Dysgonomonas sp. ZJ709]|uniref:cell division protein FtsQ/DivIB n=1 Tax=Dysgonomonas sp. ZJ709 TaxID=2709797 RepID=UPI0013EC3B31|nr:hypothetical protein [Dysgonomonas sp. ZJ709]
MKKVLVITGLCILIGYLAFSAFYFKEKPKDGLCTEFDIVVSNSENGMQFINTNDIVKYVNEKGLNPKGKPLKDINTDSLEHVILNNQLIKAAQAYVTNNGAIRVTIQERKPILRIIPNTGESYYIDNDGNKMPLSKNFTAYLPIASGAIKEDFAKGDLYNFTLFLRNDNFWNAQIEQIVVLPNDEIKLIPRVGDQQILMGQLNDYKEKLDKLMTFYKKGLNETGWNKYSVINLKYNKQVVCTKR